MKAFQAIGGFDPWYWQCQSDVDLSLRLRRNGYGVGVDLGYEVKHDGAGGKSDDPARVLDLYRARLHLYEESYPLSRIYLRPLLFLRHLAEVVWFAIARFFGKEDRLTSRVQMLKRAFHGYN
jgi:GT2 family glycosyltransferase